VAVARIPARVRAPVVGISVSAVVAFFAVVDFAVSAERRHVFIFNVLHVDGVNRIDDLAVLFHVPFRIGVPVWIEEAEEIRFGRVDEPGVAYANGVSFFNAAGTVPVAFHFQTRVRRIVGRAVENPGVVSVVAVAEGLVPHNETCAVPRARGALAGVLHGASVAVSAGNGQKNYKG